MGIKSFQDLKVWHKGHNLVLEIYRLTKTFPNEEKFGLISQIRRSSASICANIVEGYKKSTLDFVRFLYIAQGSLEETKYFLILSRDLEYCDHENFNKLFNLSDEVGLMLNGLIKRLE